MSATIFYAFTIKVTKQRFVLDLDTINHVFHKIFKTDMHRVSMSLYFLYTNPALTEILYVYNTYIILYGYIYNFDIFFLHRVSTSIGLRLFNALGSFISLTSINYNLKYNIYCYVCTTFEIV